MIELIIPEPCKSCKGMWLKVRQSELFIDADGHMKYTQPEVHCVHRPTCYKMREPVDDEKKLADKIADFLDAHPDKAITVSMHCEGGDWKHIVSIDDKNIGKF